MEDRKKGVADLLHTEQAEKTTSDPTDPKTWWLAGRRERPASLPLNGGISDHCVILTGVPAKKLFYDARVNIEVGAAVGAYYGLDSPSAGADVYNFEAEALGQKMIYGENSMPTIDFREPLIAKPRDLDKLKAPDDWLSLGRVRFIFDVFKAGAYYRNPPMGFHCAVFSLAVNIRSYPSLIRDMRKDPAFAHALFTRLVDEILPSYLKDYCGVDLSLGSSAWESFPNLSPNMIHEWVVPYAQRLLQNTMKFGMAAVPIGAADYCEEDQTKFDKQNLFSCLDAQIQMAGSPALYLLTGRTHELPLEWMAEYMDRFREKGERVTLTIALNARLMRDGPIDRIIDCVKRFIEHFGRDHNLGIIANIHGSTPPEHVHAAVAAVRAYGKLPIADDLNAIRVDVPQRKSFEDYVTRMSEGAGLRF